MPLINSLTSQNFAIQNIAIEKAQDELKRLREIEHYAKIICEDISAGFLPETELKKVWDLITSPTNPNQLTMPMY